MGCEASRPLLSSSITTDIAFPRSTRTKAIRSKRSGSASSECSSSSSSPDLSSSCLFRTRRSAGSHLTLHPPLPDLLGVHSITSITVAAFGLPGREVSWSDSLINLTMLQRYFNVPAVDGAYWTLAAELAFYVQVGALFFIGALRRRHVTTTLYAWLLVSVVVLSTDQFVPVGAYRQAVVVLTPGLIWLPLFVAGIAFFRSGTATASRTPCCSRWHAWRRCLPGFPVDLATIGVFAVFIVSLRTSLVTALGRPAVFLGEISTCSTSSTRTSATSSCAVSLRTASPRRRRSARAHRSLPSLQQSPTSSTSPSAECFGSGFSPHVLAAWRCSCVRLHRLTHKPVSLVRATCSCGEVSSKVAHTLIQIAGQSPRREFTGATRVATMMAAVPQRGPCYAMTNTHVDYRLSQLDQLKAESLDRRRVPRRGRPHRGLRGEGRCRKPDPHGPVRHGQRRHPGGLVVPPPRR